VFYLIPNQFTEQIFNKDFCYSYFEFLYNGIVIVDEEGFIMYANPKYMSLIGKDESIIGKHMSTIASNAIALGVLKSKKAAYFRRNVVPNCGADVLVSAYPLFDAADNLKGVICVLDDVQNITEIAKTLKQHNEFINRNAEYKAFDDEEKLIGKNREFKKCLSIAQKAAKTDIPILLLGETGTGKEQFAEFIHKNSKRSLKDMVKINCSTLPEQLFESELFGYEDGAFTGAKKGGKKGKLELCDKSTLFLDEIGEMPLSLQPKLLRVLENRTFEKLGGTEEKRADIRLICATNKNLRQMVAEGKFREDLFYRINNITIEIPSLRERKEDILPLINYYLDLYNLKYERNGSIQESLFTFLLKYDWPGNVRELRNVIEYLVVMSDGDIINEKHLPDSLVNLALAQREDPCAEEKIASTFAGSLKIREKQKELEKEFIIRAIKKNNFNKTEAIKELGISRYAFYKKVKEYNIVL